MKRVVSEVDELASHSPGDLVGAGLIWLAAMLAARACRGSSELLRSVVSESAGFLVPAPAVPVSPEVGGFLGNDDYMPDAGFDSARTSGTDIGLDGLVRLYRMDYFTPESGRS